MVWVKPVATILNSVDHGWDRTRDLLPPENDASALPTELTQLDIVL